MSVAEKEILTAILKKLDRIEEEIKELREYPPEEFLREDFIREVEAAEERIRKGKGREYKNISELFEKVER